MKKSKPTVECKASGKIEKNEFVTFVGWDCKTGMPIVRKWSRE